MFNVNAEFEKNPELKKDDIDHIQEWVKKQPHLPEISEQQVIMFLHSCYYRLEATKTTIENFFTIRTYAPEIFSKRDPFEKDVQESLKTMYMTKLPGKTAQGYDVFYSRLKRIEPEFYIMADIIKTYNMHSDIWNAENGTSVGHIIALDLEGISLGHVGRINMNVMKKNLSYLQDAMPVRLKGIHMLNVVPFIDMVMNMLRPFMKPHLQALFQFHQANSPEVYEHIPKSLIPKECGGDGESLSVLQAETKKILEDNVEWFKKEELQRVDESKRQGKPKDTNALFGMSGSFKKLSLD
ncbi:alpha-tocopherol transfer protein-like [Planococcus citri]|uniref:alpha-tocopherol transfer protein-like n=1 Tax=Planococcus citri TaxID=170843 RepID=UPI0031F7BD7A